ncbi:MAG TPA: hypothetical protein DDW34_01425 [Clostridium sp.]|nr:hypothetical protein [Clostridium sp.]
MIKLKHQQIFFPQRMKNHYFIVNPYHYVKFIIFVVNFMVKLLQKKKMLFSYYDSTFHNIKQTFLCRYMNLQISIDNFNFQEYFKFKFHNAKISSIIRNK